jgi:hypothetical protein
MMLERCAPVVAGRVVTSCGASEHIDEARAQPTGGKSNDGSNRAAVEFRLPGHQEVLLVAGLEAELAVIRVGGTMYEQIPIALALDSHPYVVAIRPIGSEVRGSL